MLGCLIMTNITRLYSTGTDKKRVVYYVSENPVCSVCKGDIAEDNAIYVINWTTKGHIEDLLHYNCLKNYVKHPHTKCEERRNVILTATRPLRGEIILVIPPSFRPVKGDVSVFDCEKLRSTTTDKTVFANRLSFAGANVGVAVNELPEFSEEQVNKLLEDKTR